MTPHLWMRRLSSAVVLMASVLLYAQPALAKVRGSVVIKLLRGADAVILAHVTPAHEVVVDQVYAGSLSSGERFPRLDDRVYQNCFGRIPERQLPATQFVFFLKQASTPLDVYLATKPSDHGPGFWVSPTYEFDPMVSKAVVNGRVYIYFLFDPTNPDGGVDSQFADLSALEAEIARGLELRRRWEQAQATDEPTTKLELLRPFFIPANDGFDAHSDVWSWMDPALKEVENTGTFGIAFLRELLGLSHFQEDYTAKGTWLNFGKQQRRKLQESLSRLEQGEGATPKADQ